MEFSGKILIGVGTVLIVVGGLIVLASRSHRFPLGRLPGDINIQRGGSSFFFPIVTCLVLSLLGSLILNLMQIRRR